MAIVYIKKIYNNSTRKAYKATTLGMLCCIAQVGQAGIHIPGTMMGNNTASGAICSSTQQTTGYHCILPSDEGFTFHYDTDTTSDGFPSPQSDKIFAEISTDRITLGKDAKAVNAGDVALGNDSITKSVSPSSPVTLAGTTYNHAGANPTNAISVGSMANERVIQNVAAGQISETSTDAVNGSQLYAAYNAISTIYNAQMGSYDNQLNNIDIRLNRLNDDISQLKDNAYAGISGAIAIGNLPQPSSSGKNMISGGMGTYKGHSAAAIGFSSITESEKVIWKMGATFDSKQNSGGAISVGYQW